MNEAYDFEFINRYNGSRSTAGTVEYDQTTAYFFRCLYQRILSNFKFQIPETWNAGYFKNVLFGMGYIAVIRTPKYGVIPQIAGLTGHGIFLQPTRVLVAQPLITFEGTIGEDCEVIKLCPDYSGIMDIVEHYAVQLSKCYTSINVSLVNSRVGLVAFAKNKQAAEALKYIQERLTGGDTLVVSDKVVKDPDEKDPLVMTFGDPSKCYITDKLLADFTTILNTFDREVGIPVINEKKERMITQEAVAQLSASGPRIETWKESLTDSIKRVNDLFGLDITFTTRGDDTNEGEANTDRAE